MKFYHIRCPGFLMKSIYILGNDGTQHPLILYLGQHLMSGVGFLVGQRVNMLDRYSVVILGLI